MTTSLTVKECLSFGWTTFKKRPWFFVGVSVAYLVAHFILVAIEGVLPEFISPIVGIVGGTFLAIGLLTVYLRAHDNLMGVKYQDLWNPKPFWRYLVTSIITGIIVFIGFLLLIVPGVILALAFSFALYIVLERNVWTLTALRESARITRGSRVKLLLLALAMAGLNIVGAVVVLVGLFVSIPVSLLASIHAYRTLASRPAIAEAATPVETPAVV